MIDRVAGNHALPDTIRQDIIERTDGIPLFVEEITKAVLEAKGEQAIDRVAAAIPVSSLAVPPSLHASLMARLDRLGSAKDIVQIGAAMGREFSHGLLAAVARRPEARHSILFGPPRNGWPPGFGTARRLTQPTYSSTRSYRTRLRQEVRPFTEKQIELFTNFANQAVIAIENARLLNELRQRTADLTASTTDLTEALEQQTATSEVLQVISSSPGDLEPVFATMLENATRICEAKFGVMQVLEGDGLRAVSFHDVPAAYAEAMRRDPVFRPVAGHPLDRVASTKQVVHIPDVRAEQRLRGWIVELAGARTLLCVPMLKDNTFVGVISIYRQEVRSFTDKQIALVQNFAAQAVIATENARLLNELRQRTTDLTDALEQQTATSEVLQAISSFPGDLQPVFAAMLENAVRICDATFGNIFRWDGDAFNMMASHKTPGQHSRRRVSFHLFGRLQRHFSVAW